MMLYEKQTNHQSALEMGYYEVCHREAAALRELGAVPVAEHAYELSVMNAVFLIDLLDKSVRLKGLPDVPQAVESIRIQWRILALHYLASTPPWPLPSRWVTFADLAHARGYESVYRGRVLGRLCGTAARAKDTFVEACRRAGGAPLEYGDVGFVFSVFKHVNVGVVRFDGDEELPPSVSFLYSDNILSFLSAEDVVILSEQLITHLQGKGW